MKDKLSITLSDGVKTGLKFNTSHEDLWCQLKPFYCFAISDEPPQRHPQPLSKYTEGVEIFKSCNEGETE